MDTVLEFSQELLLCCNQLHVIKVEVHLQIHASATQLPVLCIMSRKRSYCIFKPRQCCLGMLSWMAQGKVLSSVFFVERHNMSSLFCASNDIGQHLLGMPLAWYTMCFLFKKFDTKKASANSTQIHDIKQIKKFWLQKALNLRLQLNTNAKQPESKRKRSKQIG